MGKPRAGLREVSWVAGLQYTDRFRRLTETFIPDCTGFLFVFKAWSLRIVNYVKASTTPKTGKKTRKVV